MKDKEKLIFGLIVLILFIWATQQPQFTFILFGGQEMVGFVSNTTGICYTLSTSDTCVQQKVNLINFTEQNLLVCPEGYYSTKHECELKYGIKAVEKPKIECYFIGEDDRCYSEYFLQEEGCPATYFTTLDACEEEAETFITHISLLFKNKSTVIALIAGVIAILILFLKKL